MVLNAIFKHSFLQSAIRIHHQRALVLYIQRCNTHSTFLMEGDKDESFSSLADKKQENYLEKLKSDITVDQPNVLSNFSGVPPEHVLNRRVRIYIQAKNSMQSGTADTQRWKLDFENRERWENPLMGWTSTGDPLSNMNLYFSTKEEAIEYCQRQGYYYEVDEPQTRRNLRKSYAENFSWGKRTRVGSK